MSLVVDDNRSGAGMLFLGVVWGESTPEEEALERFDQLWGYSHYNCMYRR